MMISISVPDIAAVQTVSLPPISLARSRMPWRPKCLAPWHVGKHCGGLRTQFGRSRHARSGAGSPAVPSTSTCNPTEVALLAAAASCSPRVVMAWARSLLSTVEARNPCTVSRPLGDGLRPDTCGPKSERACWPALIARRSEFAATTSRPLHGAPVFRRPRLSHRGTIVKKVLSSVVLGALLTIGSAVMAAGSDADPVVGTWKLNLAKINVRWRSGIEEPNSYLLAVCAGHNPEDEDC